MGVEPRRGQRGAELAPPQRNQHRSGELLGRFLRDESGVGAAPQPP